MKNITLAERDAITRAYDELAKSYLRYGKGPARESMVTLRLIFRFTNHADKPTRNRELLHAILKALLMFGIGAILSPLLREMWWVITGNI